MKLEVLSHFDSGAQLAQQAASDLASHVLMLLKEKAVHVVLTGGTVGIRTLAELAPLLEEHDLTNLNLWWGDDRFVDVANKERNYVQAEEVLLSRIDIPSENLHPMPPSGTSTLEEAATAFADHIEMERPEFDLVLLGMGQDGHVASLFPGSNPTTHGALVISEANSPKPPPSRISLSFAALSSAKQVWFLVSGADKASAVGQVFTEKNLPAAQVSGQRLTRWYLDQAAAEKITS